MLYQRTLVALAVGVLWLGGCDAGEPVPTDEPEVVGPAVQEEYTAPVEEGAVDELPVRVSGPNIEYPERLRHDGVEGYVLLSAVVNADGSVDQQSVTVDSSTHVDFEAPAVAWLEGATFTPGTVDGKEVRVRIKLPVAFKLSK